MRKKERIRKIKEDEIREDEAHSEALRAFLNLTRLLRSEQTYVIKLVLLSFPG